MRSRILFFMFLLAAGAFALPLAAHASIPFFGPIIPETNPSCPASWGMLVTVINNIIMFLLTLAIVFVAPLMIAYSGFLFVVNPVNAGGKEHAKQILTNTIVGIVIALAAWMIIGAIMAVLYNPDGKSGWGTWEALMTSGGSAGDCLGQSGGGAYVPPSPPAPPPVTVVPPTCKISPLSSVLDTDPLAQQMEAMNGNAVIWANTDPRLQKCANKFVSALRNGSSVEKNTHITSAYRPQAYQTHLWEIHDRWCTQGLKSSTNTACYQLKSDVLQEASKHSLSGCGAVGATSQHTTGKAVDIGGIVNPGNLFERDAAKASCLDWKNYPGDKYHYELMISCTCQ